MNRTIGTAAALAAVTIPNAAAAEAKAEGLTIASEGADPRKGPAKTFTGDVTVSGAFEGTGASRISGATVTFDAGARTNWHRHPLGQLLVVTEGNGLIQKKGGPVQQIARGDVVWIPPGVDHWHGAAPDTAMTHAAIAEKLDGEVVDWFGAVTDAQYAGE